MKCGSSSTRDCRRSRRFACVVSLVRFEEGSGHACAKTKLSMTLHHFVRSRRQVRGLEFDPFCPNNLATGGGDGMVKVWSIPPEGLKEDLISPLVSINTGALGAVGQIWWAY